MKQENEKKPKKEVSLFAAVLLFVVVCAAIAIQKGVLNGIWVPCSLCCGWL